MRVIVWILTIGICLASLPGVVPASAQSQREDRVTVGASLRDVLAAWGEPNERIVRGVKRELVWSYKGGARVVFKDGKVVTLRGAGDEQKIVAKKVAMVENVKKVDVETTESRDILRDIVREIPSGSDGGSSGPSASVPSSDPSLEGLIPNAVPPSRGGPAGIAPGVVVPSLEDEEEQ
jgi:hypothetical protein